MRLHKESIDRVFDYSLHLETRTLFLDEGDREIDAGISSRVVKSLHLLLAHDREKPIRIVMNSRGGCWFSGLAMFDAIRASTAHVTIECYGACMSMATVVLQAADERILHPNLTFMIHDGGNGYEGDSRSFEAWGRHSERARQTMYKIYSEKSGKPVSYWKLRCGADHIVTAEEAVAMGLADRISTGTG